MKKKWKKKVKITFDTSIATNKNFPQPGVTLKKGETVTITYRVGVDWWGLKVAQRDEEARKELVGYFTQRFEELIDASNVVD